MMRLFKFIGVVAILACAIGAPRLVSRLAAQSGGGTSAAEALRKAAVQERLVERTAPRVPKTGTAPSFVVDPAWPKPLPNNWTIGDIGGLFVDRHDHIWVFHRPRSLTTTEDRKSTRLNSSHT